MIDTVIAITVLCIIVFALMAFIIWRQRVFDQRETDLITRLMSRNAPEYAQVKQMTSRVAAPVTVADAVEKLYQEGIDVDEIPGISGDESATLDRVRV